MDLELNRSQICTRLFVLWSCFWNLSKISPQLSELSRWQNEPNWLTNWVELIVALPMSGALAHCTLSSLSVRLSRRLVARGQERIQSFYWCTRTCLPWQCIDNFCAEIVFYWLTDGHFLRSLTSPHIVSYICLLLKCQHAKEASSCVYYTYVYVAAAIAVALCKLWLDTGTDVHIASCCIEWMLYNRDVWRVSTCHERWRVEMQHCSMTVE